MNFDTSEKLLTYCVKQKHWSIFEQVDLTFEIKTSKAISAQLLRHKTASFQEFSARYAEVPSIENIELRKQGSTNRQSGEEIFDGMSDEVSKFVQQSLDLYQKMLSNGVSRETARFILPCAMQSTLYMKNNLRNWLAYLNVRLHKTTQKEHRKLANCIAGIIIKEFPITSKCLNYFSDSFELYFI